LNNLYINQISEKTYNKIIVSYNIKAGPFSNIDVIRSVSKSLITNNELKSEILTFSIEDNFNTIKSIGLLFKFEVQGHKILLSGGRFGFSQIQNISSKINEIDIQKCFDKFSLTNNISLCSLAFDYNKLTSENKNLEWKSKKKTYLIANIFESCKNGKLNILAAIKRSSLSRGIKLAKKNEIVSYITYSEKLLEDWYFSCHVPRINELDGVLWDLNVFKELLKSNYAGLCLANNFNQKNILGGCFFVKNENTLELFMMSSTRKNQELGVNYSISEKLYSFASEMKINWLNWQSSSPNSQLVNFKKKWNSKEYNFIISTRLFNKNININFLKSKLKNFFIYPEL
jgi:hypothetical protein